MNIGLQYFPNLLRWTQKVTNEHLRYSSDINADFELFVLHLTATRSSTGIAEVDFNVSLSKIID